MKTKLLLVGFLAGIAAGIVLTVMVAGQKAMAGPRTPRSGGDLPRSEADWPDSLDAVKAAPANHKIVFENDKIRILEVVGDPYVLEPLHTHQWPGVMWSASPNFAKAHLIYYHYDYDPVKKIYFIKDSVLEQGPPANKGFEIPAEGPHRVRNLSNLDIVAYRVEFKK